MTATGTAGARAATPEQRIGMYTSMVEIRIFEKRVFDLFLLGLVRYSTHLSIGQEAIAAGFAAAMRPDDMMFCTYRGHGHTLARGVGMESVLGELMGRASGLNGGKGGSIHLTSVEHGVMGSYAIVGAHLPIANGAAWSAQLRGTGQVVVCYFGDGATNIGAFHEALNLAAVWKLPVVFVCENNLYMEYTPIRQVTAVDHPAAGRASAYGLESIVIDGNDPDAVFVAAARALDRCRSGEGPAMVEAMTYRHFGHSRGDPALYRDQAEVDEWLLRDPLPVYRTRLLEEGLLDERELAEIDARVEQDVEAATEAARAAPRPDPGALLTELWADGGSRWRS